MPVPRVLTYFGEKSGRSVFYDVRQRKVFRFPSASLFIEADIDEPASD